MLSVVEEVKRRLNPKFGTLGDKRVMLVFQKVVGESYE